MQGANLTFGIAANDNVEGVIARINKALFGVGKAAKQASEGQGGGIAGIGVQARAALGFTRELGERGTKALEQFGRAAGDVGSKLGAFSPALAGLTSIASLGGLAAITRQSAEFRTGIIKASAQVGLSTLDLQKWINAMDRAGFSAENTTSMLGNVNAASLNARAGLDPRAMGIAQLKHIDISGDTRKTILSIADAIKKKMDEAGENPESEGQVLDAFGISRDHIALFEQGGAAIQKLLDARGVLSQQQIDQLNALDKSFRGLEQSAGDFGKAIAAGISAPLIEANDKVSALLDNFRKTPSIMNEVEDAATVLGGVLTAGLTVQIARLINKVTGLSVALRFLFLNPFGAPITAAVAAAGVAKGAAGQIDRGELPYNGIDPTIDPFGLSGQSSPTSMNGPGPRPGEPLGGSGSPASGYGAGDAGAAQYAIDMIESDGGKNYNNAPYPGHSATGRRQIIPSTWAMYARPGERIDREADNVAVSNRIIADLWDKYHDWDKVAYSYANGSPSAPDLNPGYVAKFRKYFAEYARRDASLKTSADGGGDQKNFTAPASTPDTFSGMDAEASNFWQYNQAHPNDTLTFDQYKAMEASNSSHEVTINIAGAPPGTRSSVNSASGNAKLNLRTSYSMGDPW